MPDPKMVSERDAVEREREAYVRGWCDHGGYADRGRGNASRLYPHPKVERPRVVKDPVEGYDQEWMCKDGQLYFRVPTLTGYGWVLLSEFGQPINARYPHPKRIRMWADLLEHPTELVEEDA